MRYIDKLKTIESDAADNALIIGAALHTGIEKNVETAIKEYFFSYPIISDAHITEAMKLEMQIEKARAVVPPGQHEVLIETEKFKGFIDLLVPVEDGVFDIWDFKYSNNVSHYMESRQLHLYKYYFEKTHPGQRIRKLVFLFVPKNSSRQKKDETLYQFRERVIAELSPTEVKPVEVPFDYSKVIEHLELVQDVQEETEYEANQGWLCKYCEYEDFCQKGRNYMILPSAERRNISETKKRKIWIYGAAFSGKTTMLDNAPNPLNLNTDGNIQFVTMPYISIKDEVKVEGRITKRKYAWEVFKEAIAELEKGQNSFKTIIVDLLEDTREACRVYMYDQLKIQHESDSGYGKGWDIIKTEYLSTIRRLFNLDYENIIVVSHEDVSKDITKKNGQNITRIAPNIQDAIANKVAGMVDIVARVVVEDDGTRTLNFKSNEVIFGGGRLKGIQQTTIPLSWDALMQVYDEANANVATASQETPAASAKSGRKTRKAEDTSESTNPIEGAMNPPEQPEENAPDEQPEADKPKAGRTRRSGKTVEQPGDWQDNTDSVTVVLEKDTYFFRPSDGNYLMKHKGDSVDLVVDGETVLKEITKEEFGEGIKKIATEGNPSGEAASETSNEPGKRTRRSRRS
jgi:phage nucleotide-binding protein